MKRENNGDWKRFKALPKRLEIDFHWWDRGPRERDYWEVMNDVRDTALAALKRAQDEGYTYILFTHGWSTSGPFKTTARSVVRKLMRSPQATPYIVRKDCIQHYSVFVVAVRPKAYEPVQVCSDCIDFTEVITFDKLSEHGLIGPSPVHFAPG